MVLYQIVILGEADEPQGLKEALAMACEAVGSAKVTKVEVLDAQQSLGGYNAARAKLEAALGRMDKCKQ